MGPKKETIDCTSYFVTGNRVPGMYGEFTVAGIEFCCGNCNEMNCEFVDLYSDCGNRNLVRCEHCGQVNRLPKKIFKLKGNLND